MLGNRSFHLKETLSSTYIITLTTTVFERKWPTNACKFIEINERILKANIASISTLSWIQ